MYFDRISRPIIPSVGIGKFSSTIKKLSFMISLCIDNSNFLVPTQCTASSVMPVSLAASCLFILLKFWFLHMDTSAPVSIKNFSVLLMLLHFTLMNALDFAEMLKIFIFGLLGQLLLSSGLRSFPAAPRMGRLYNFYFGCC